MGTELEPLAKVQDQIRERIKAEFASLIPDEMWTQLVQSVVKDFTSDTPGQYGHRERNMSPVKKLIADAIEAEAKQHVAVALDTLRPQWGGYGEEIVTTAVKKLVADNFEELLKSAQHGMVSFVVALAIQKLRDGMGQY